MTSWGPSRAVLLVLAVGAMGAAGCGSSRGSSSHTTPAGRGFTAELDAACRADIAATRAAPKTVAAQSAAQRTFIRKLQGLRPTPTLEPIFSKYLSLLERNLAAFERHNVAASKQLEAQIAPILATLRHAGATSC